MRGASLSLIAACTTDTYATMIDQAYFAIGFLNRLCSVADRSDKMVAIPGQTPGGRLDERRDSVGDLLGRIQSAYQSNECRPVAYPIAAEALGMFEDW